MQIGKIILFSHCWKKMGKINLLFLLRCCFCFLTLYFLILEYFIMPSALLLPLTMKSSCSVCFFLFYFCSSLCIFLLTTCSGGYYRGTGLGHVLQGLEFPFALEKTNRRKERRKKRMRRLLM